MENRKLHRPHQQQFFPSPTMNPLSRQPSRLSVLSWWSNSNPNLENSATINLHAAAKPLMRFLYHRQAITTVRKNSGKPLTSEMLEIYASYLPWDYVSVSTKTMILSVLNSHIEHDFKAAESVLNSPVIPHLKPMLELPGVRFRALLGEQVRHLIQGIYLKDAAALIEQNCSRRLSPDLLTTYALYLQLPGPADHIIEMVLSDLNLRVWVRPVEAQTIVDSPVFSLIPQLLESSISSIRAASTELLEKLVANIGVLAVLELDVCSKLVALLRDDSKLVVEPAISVLSHIATSLEGAKIIIPAVYSDIEVSGGDLNYPFCWPDQQLFKSRPKIRTQARKLMKRLAAHDVNSTGVSIRRNPAIPEATIWTWHRHGQGISVPL
ncbi:hypothetical protein R3P38DRAFT_3504365 [Favolaschia claudopus]|uniref:Uncharacterized protein n=1 Tax=Favolaschia claudopus TaxID=2862362 RepID=A0AAW0C4L9_9AGAR